MCVNSSSFSSGCQWIFKKRTLMCTEIVTSLWSYHRLVIFLKAYGISIAFLLVSRTVFCRKHDFGKLRSGTNLGVQDMAFIVILWLAIQGRRVVAIVLCWMLDAVVYAKPMLCQYCRRSEIIPSLKCWKLPFRFCAIFCLQKGSYFSGGALSASSGVPDIGKALDGERWLYTWAIPVSDVCVVRLIA